MSQPINPPTAIGSGRRELPAYVSNGLIGMRVRDLPFTAGMTLLSGYTGEHPERKIEAAAVAPYPLAADLAIDGVWLSDAPHQAGDFEQAYDFASGELTTRFRFRAGGKAARVEVLTFCSRADPTLACQEITVTLDAACEVSLRAIVDATDADGRPVSTMRDTPGEEAPAVDGALLWESAGALSTCGVALVTRLTGAGETQPNRPPLMGDCLSSEYAVKARAGRSLRLIQIASLVPSVMHASPDQHAVRLAAKAKRDGFETLRARNRALWDELWKSRIVLHGAGEYWQGLTDAAFFYLNASVHPSSPSSTSIFGLATWHDYHYYYGHVMWDIEAFAIPPLSVLQPPAAHALLDYRWRNLAGARRNAQLFGRRGLQFPWESAPGSGEEAAPLPGTAAWHEDHVSLDVAHAFAFLAATTGDEAFARLKAWPVLVRRRRVADDARHGNRVRLRHRGVDGHRRARGSGEQRRLYQHVRRRGVERSHRRRPASWPPGRSRMGAHPRPPRHPEARQGRRLARGLPRQRGEGRHPRSVDGDLSCRLPHRRRR